MLKCVKPKVNGEFVTRSSHKHASYIIYHYGEVTILYIYSLVSMEPNPLNSMDFKSVITL